MRMIKELDLKILNQSFEEFCDMELGALPSRANQAQSGLKKARIDILLDSNSAIN